MAYIECKIAGLDRIPKLMWPGSLCQIFMGRKAWMGREVIISSIAQPYTLRIKADYHREIRQSC